MRSPTVVAVTPIVDELLRIRSDRSTRLGITIGLAVLYLIFVFAQDVGAATDLVAVLLAPSLVLWRRLPVVAIGLAAIACIALPVSQLSTRWGIFSLGPLLLVVLPILGGSLDARSWVRGAGLALAAIYPIAIVLWAARMQAASFGLLMSTAVLAAGPVVAATIWRRPGMRTAIVAFLRERAPLLERDSSRFQIAVAVAVGAYLLAVVLGLGERDLRPVVTAAPAAAAIIWFRSRTDVSLALGALGLVLVTLLAPIDPSFRTGLTLTCLYAVVPVFGAATSGSRVLRRVGIGLVIGVALVGALMTGSVAFGFTALGLGGLPYLFDLLANQTRSARRLRTRLTQSEQRGEVAERDVRIEQERNRIAREVHDVVAHSLAVVIAQADGARFAAESSPQSVGPALEAIADTARTALGEVRTMLHDLKEDGGGTVAPGADDIPALLDGVRALDVEVEEAVFGEPATLIEQADLAMFRIVQEALTNALRHGAKPATVRVETDWGDTSVVVAVTNVQDPFAPAATERAGHGIRGMQERAVLAGGECTAGPGSDGSFRVRVVLPVDRSVAAPLDEEADEVAADDPLSLLFGVRPALARA